MSSADRWTIALHEAGHGVSAIVLGGKCDGLALLDDESGLAQTDQLLGDRDAWCVAAGPAAEGLAAEYEPPTTKPAKVDAEHFERLPVFETAPHLALAMAKAPERRKKHQSDDSRLALWSIDGFVDQPEKWAERVARAHRVAAEIVRANAAGIVAVARELFVHGNLSGDEITKLAAEHGSLKGSF